MKLQKVNRPVSCVRFQSKPSTQPKWLFIFFKLLRFFRGQKSIRFTAITSTSFPLDSILNAECVQLICNSILGMPVNGRRPFIIRPPSGFGLFNKWYFDSFASHIYPITFPYSALNFRRMIRNLFCVVSCLDFS